MPALKQPNYTPRSQPEVPDYMEDPEWLQLLYAQLDGVDSAARERVGKILRRSKRSMHPLRNQTRSASSRRIHDTQARV